MVELTVTLPDWAGEYIEKQIKAGRCASADELLTELIDEERVLVADERLAELIREGLESGDGGEINEQWWEQRRAEVRAELQRRRSA